MKKLIIVIVLAQFFFACKKDKEVTPEPTKEYVITYFAYPKGTTPNYSDVLIQCSQRTGNNATQILSTHMTSAKHSIKATATKNQVFDIYMKSANGNNDLGFSIQSGPDTVYEDLMNTDGSITYKYTVTF